MKRQRGSTLILALLIITVVSTMAFGTGQLYVSEVRIVNTLEGATGAQYAAESAIEEGIREFRLNRGFQRCEVQGVNAQDKDCMSDTNRKGRDEAIGLANVNWKAWYLDKVAGDLIDDDQITLADFPVDYTQAKLKINNNESRLFDVTRVVKNADGTSLNGDVDLYFKYYNCVGPDTTDANSRCASVRAGRSGSEFAGGPVMEIRLISSSVGQPVIVQLVDGVLEGTTPTTSALFSNSGVDKMSGEAGFTSNNAFKITGMLEKISGFQAFEKQNLRSIEIKIFGADIAIGLDAKPSGSALIDNSVTTIEALGSMGDSKRKLVAEVDRKHGTLIGVNSYTLYGEGGLDFELLPD